MRPQRLFHADFLEEAGFFQSVDEGIVKELPRVGILGVRKFFLVEIVKLSSDGFRLGPRDSWPSKAQMRRTSHLPSAHPRS